MSDPRDTDELYRPDFSDFKAIIAKLEQEIEQLKARQCEARSALTRQQTVYAARAAYACGATKKNLRLALNASHSEVREATKGIKRW